MEVKKKLALSLSLLMLLGSFTACKKIDDQGSQPKEAEKEVSQEVEKEKEDPLKAYAFADTSFFRCL